MSWTRRRLSIGAALGAVAVAATATAWACTAEHAGTLSLNTTSAKVGDMVTLTASGLSFKNAPHDVLFLDPSIYASAVGGANKCNVAGQPMLPNPVVNSDASGAFTVSEKIPTVTMSGTAAICVSMAKVSGPFPDLINITVV